MDSLHKVRAVDGGGVEVVTLIDDVLDVFVLLVLQLVLLGKDGRVLKTSHFEVVAVDFQVHLDLIICVLDVFVHFDPFGLFGG